MHDLRQTLEDNFLQTLERLNVGQRQAVEQIEGPVMVIAGPGTGKTQILSSRIGQILLSDAMVGPHNILCLTYTDAGAIAMRERLQQMIGPDAHRVHIFTFHAFCNKVIQENMETFGIRELQPVSELERIEVLEKLMSSWGPTHPLFRVQGYLPRDTGKLFSLFSEMKRENLSPAYLNERIDSYLAELPDREEYQYKRKYREFKAGDPKPTAIAEETRKMEATRAAVNEFAGYQAAMREMGRYDYDDMILWVKEELEKNRFMRLNYQERYLYILVDEFQDTNGTQLAILNILTKDADLNSNVFTVGDDDQAIYRFQGAKVKNMTDFRERYGSNLLTVPLTENYRSSQKILNASTILIRHNLQRLSNSGDGGSKKLIASNLAIKDLDEQVRLLTYPDPLQEQVGLAEELIRLHREGADLNEVAVIYRKHSHVENLTKLLEQAGVPFNVRRKVNVLTEPFVRNLILILEYLSAEQERPDSGQHLLFYLMHLRFFNLSARDVASISRHMHLQKKTQSAWRVTLCDRECLTSLGLENVGAVLAFENRLNSWAEEMSGLTVPQLFEKVLTEGGVLTHIMRSPESTWLMELCDTFFSFIISENERDPQMRLSDLIATVQKMTDNGVSLDRQRIVWAENAVNLLTAHSAKGLEFERVYLICANKTGWEKQRARGGYKLPDNLGGPTSETPQEEQVTEDERRLFFVAMTRAKKHLQISYSQRDVKGKSMEVSRFVDEVLVGGEIMEQDAHVPPEALLKAKVILMTALQRPKSKLIDRALVAEALRNYSLSATHLNRYLACPLGFYFESILRVPSAPNDALGFGDAVHGALEELFLARKRSSEGKFPIQEDFILMFKKRMASHRASFTEEQFKRRLEFGEKVLSDFYAHSLPHWQSVKETHVEYNIKNVEFKGVPLIGTLDKLEFLGANLVHVVDYKTGNPANAKEKLNAPMEDKLPDGGNYWRQMYFYQILMDSDLTKPWQMSSGEFSFIQPLKYPNGQEEIKAYKVPLTPENREIVEKQIVDTYRRIMGHEFAEGCGDCDWCSFVKENYEVGEMMVLLSQVEVEEDAEDDRF